MQSAILLLAAAGAFVLYQYIIYPIFFSPLAKVPAVHPLAKITPLYVLWLRLTHRENGVLKEAHKTHEVVRLGPKELSVNCVDDGIKTIYGRGFDKPPFYSTFDEFHTTCLFSSLESRPHAQKKKRISHIYSKSHLLTSPAAAGMLRELLHKHFLPRIAASAKTGASFDALSLHSAVATDFTTGYFFGLTNGTRHLSNEQARIAWHHDFANSRPVDTQIWLHELPQLTRWLKNFGIYTMPKSRWLAWDAIDSWFLGLCDGAERTLADPDSYSQTPEDFPSVYSHLKNAVVKEGYSDTPSVRVDMCGLASKHIDGDGDVEKWRLRSPRQLEIAAELLDQLVASHDAMGLAMTFIVYEMSKHPEVQKKLREELRTLGNGLRLNSEDEMPTASQIDSLQYLRACLMEGMRLHPAVAGGQARITPPNQNTTIGMYNNIPGGTRVQAAACCLHMNPEIFPEPERFIPERWLEDEKDKASGEDKKERWFWAFGSGSRMCIGSNLAMVIMRHVMSAMYTNFETYIVNDDGIEQYDGFISPPVANQLIIGARPVA